MSTITAVTCPICAGPVEPLDGYEPLGLLHCEACDFAMRPAYRAELREAHDADYFDTYAGGTAFDNRLKRREARVRLRLVRYTLLGRGGERLLEVGCGAGHFLAEARRLRYEPTGIEQSREALEKGGVADGIPVKVGFVEDVELEPATFDAVCMWHVIEHLPDPLPVLVSLRKALKPGGMLLCEVPNFPCPRSRADGLTWTGLQPKHHVGHHSPKSLRLLLERAGFTSVKTTTTMPYVYMSLSERLRPRTLLRRARYAKLCGTLAIGEHRDRFDLLRANARVG